MDMIGRVAKALDACEIVGTLEWQTTEARMENRRRQARAAIEAMREPTQHMLIESSRGADNFVSEEQWRHMINAALKRD